VIKRFDPREGALARPLHEPKRFYDTTWNVKLFFRLSWTEVLQGHKDL